VSDSLGNVLERLSYDVWGQRRNASGSDDTTYALKGNQDRTGYTGQEHLDELDLIHMNGRVYDPMIGRFTSADPNIPDPTNHQNFNRYSYVLNNPLAYTDPSGFMQFELNGSALPDFAPAGGQSGDAPPKKEGNPKDPKSEEEKEKLKKEVEKKIREQANCSNSADRSGCASKRATQIAAANSALDSVGNGSKLQELNRAFEKLQDTPGTSGAMLAMLDVYVHIKEGDPTGSMGAVPKTSAVVDAQLREGGTTVDAGMLAPAAAAAMAAGAVVGAPAANNAGNVLKLKNQLASQGQMAEAGTIMAGPGGRVPFRDALRLVSEFGGKALDWVKKTSSSFTDGKGTRFETHWVENIKTGQRVEFKTKFPENK
jgi:RHS repeat-associated protein